MAWPLVETFCGFPYLCDGELLRQLLDPLVVGQVGGLLLALGLNLTAQLSFNAKVWESDLLRV